MKTIIFSIAVMLLSTTILNAQEAEKKDKSEPEEQIIVNKEYDENGNLIRFDSTYTFEWHGDTIMAPDHDGFFSPDELWGDFFNDSLNRFSPFNDEWGQNFFEDHENFMRQFEEQFFNGHEFNPDFWSDHQINPDSLQNIPDFAFPFNDFNMPGMSEFFKNFEEFYNPDSHSFDNYEQQKEWEEIMKRYQEEIEDFNNKWDSRNKSKPGADFELQKL